MKQVMTGLTKRDAAGRHCAGMLAQRARSRHDRYVAVGLAFDTILGSASGCARERTDRSVRLNRERSQAHAAVDDVSKLAVGEIIIERQSDQLVTGTFCDVAGSGSKPIAASILREMEGLIVKHRFYAMFREVRYKRSAIPREGKRR